MKLSSKVYKKLLIVDGSNMIHRQLNNSELFELSYNGNKTGGIYGFLRSMQVVMTRFKDYYPVVIFDHGRSPRRLAIYPNYKHQLDRDNERAEKKKLLESGQVTADEVKDEFLNELIRQSDILKTLLREFNIPVVSIPKWEGDDLITILSRMTDDYVVITEDKDMYQLLSPKGRIFRPMRVDSEGKRGLIVTYEEYLSPKYNNIRYLAIEKAIVGDGSDNVPKVCYGVGGKTAEKISTIIQDSNEDYSVYSKELYDKGGKFLKFLQNIRQYAINLQLVDLSIVKDDPYVVDKIYQEMKSSMSEVAPNFIEILKILSANGISNFDYNRFLQSMTISRGYQNE